MAIVALQILHLVLFFTDAIASVAEKNVMTAFLICAGISLGCFLLSLWAVLPFSKFDNGVKYFLLFFAIIQVCVTIVMFLLPEGGMPAPIQF